MDMMKVIIEALREYVAQGMEVMKTKKGRK